MIFRVSEIGLWWFFVVGDFSIGGLCFGVADGWLIFFFEYVFLFVFFYCVKCLNFDFSY